MNTSVYKVKQIGRVCELSVQEVLDKSIEELIDQGKRFVILNEKDEDSEDVLRYDS